MRVLVIIPEEKFNNTEFNTVIKYLRLNQFKYDIASSSGKIATGYIAKEFDNKPMMIRPDLSISEIKVEMYNCIIIIGGSGNKKYLWNNLELHDVIQQAYKNDIILGAICLAPISLVNSGIIKSSSITAYKTRETQRIIQTSGNYYSEVGVCVNGRIITANGPKSSKKFIEAIISQLKEII